MAFPISKMCLRRIQGILHGVPEGRKYKITNPIGKGSYGLIFEAVTVSKDKVALKMTKGCDEDPSCIPISTHREISLLDALPQHPNVIQILGVILSPGFCFIVLELYGPNLGTHIEALKDSGQCTMESEDLHSFTHQILAGLAFMHSHGIMHRDIKLGNLLLDSSRKCLKIADFGMGIFVKSTVGATYTAQVTTYPYRAPEVFLGCGGKPHDEDGELTTCRYTLSADVWGAGVVVVEMINFGHILETSSELEYLQFIFSVLGKPSERTWPGVTSLPGYTIDFALEESDYDSKKAAAFLKHPVDGRLESLVCSMLVLNPEKRISAEGGAEAACRLL